MVAIVNPASGGGRGGRAALAQLTALPGAEIRTTTGPGHATALAHAAVQDGADVIVAAGGDGTLFEVVNGLLPHDGDKKLPALAVLPVGTGNSFFRDLDLDSAEAAIAAIHQGRRRAIDALQVDHTGGRLHAVNLVSVGFSADAGKLMNDRFKGLGAVGYVAAVVVSLAGLDATAFPYALDDGPLDTTPSTLLSLCNSRFTGGAMQMAPDADPSDGLLDVVQIGAMSRRRFLSSFPRIFRGTHIGMAEVRTARAASVRFDGVSTLPVMIDGEVRDLAPTRVTVLPGALTVAA